MDGVECERFPAVLGRFEYKYGSKTNFALRQQPCDGMSALVETAWHGIFEQLTLEK